MYVFFSYSQILVTNHTLITLNPVLPLHNMFYTFKILHKNKSDKNKSEKYAKKFGSDTMLLAY